MLSLLFLLLHSIRAAWICSPGAPDDLLVERMALCRSLHEPVCVDTRVGGSFSQAVLTKDAELILEYTSVSATQTPKCTAAWRDMVCSKAFPASVSQTAPCDNICQRVAAHCFGIRCTSATLCTDYSRRAQCTRKTKPVEPSTPQPPAFRPPVYSAGTVRHTTPLFVALAMFTRGFQ